MARFEEASSSSSSSSAVGIRKNTTATTIILLLLVTITTCGQVSASSSMVPAPSATAPTAPTTTTGVIYMVGDAGGWTVIPGCGLQDFQAWADARTFHPGDTLHFWRSKNSDGDVTQVTRQDFDTCTISSPLAVHTGRSVYIKLEHEGDYYFTSGAHNYCVLAFQKVHIKVVPRPLSPRSSALPLPHSSSAPAASYADHHHTSSATSISPTQRLSRWIVGLSLLVLISYV